MATSARRLAPLSIVIAGATSAMFADAPTEYPLAPSTCLTSTTPPVLTVIDELALSLNVPTAPPAVARKLAMVALDRLTAESPAPPTTMSAALVRLSTVAISRNDGEIWAPPFTPALIVTVLPLISTLKPVTELPPASVIVGALSATWVVPPLITPWASIVSESMAASVNVPLPPCAAR